MPVVRIDLSEKDDYKQFIHRVRERIPRGELMPFIRHYYAKEDILKVYFRLSNYLQGTSFRSGKEYDFAKNLVEYFKQKQGIDLTDFTNG